MFLYQHLRMMYCPNMFLFFLQQFKFQCLVFNPTITIENYLKKEQINFDFSMKMVKKYQHERLKQFDMD